MLDQQAKEEGGHKTIQVKEFIPAMTEEQEPSQASAWNKKEPKRDKIHETTVHGLRQGRTAARETGDGPGVPPCPGLQ